MTQFDYLWAEYERKYVGELMVIESDARRYIIESINLEAVIGQGHMQLPAMKQKFDEQRKALLHNICQVNSVANVEGKGRDDFEFALLEQSESLVKPPQVNKYSKAVTKLANEVLGSYDAYRALMREYQSNIELVDPQMRNNEPLVKVVSDFENAWSIAQNQIANPERLSQLDLFSNLLKQTQQDLPQFKEQVECRDASIFMSIPALLIMQALLQSPDSDDQTRWHALCKRFKEDITNCDDWIHSQESFESLR